MRFEFTRLGALDKAEVEIAPLTIICGRNNTGKTYVTYAIHAFLATWRQLIKWEPRDEDILRLQKVGAVSIDMQAEFVDRWPELSAKLSRAWKEYLPQALAAPADRFKDTVVTLDLKLDDSWKRPNFKKEFRSEQGKLLFSAEKPGGSSIVEFVAVKDDDSIQFPRFALDDFITQALVEAVLSPFIPKPFMVSTERTGAVAFKEELNLTKNKIVNLLAKIESGKDVMHPGQLFEAVYKRGYPLPVERNVQFVNSFGSLESRTGPLLIDNPHLVQLFENITGGKYETNKEGVTHFVPKGYGTKLQLSEASSAVRSLVVVWYWLKTQAEVGNLLLIDEPELNLHPENQRAFARFLARLVNLGIKVLITTHSDVIVREFNTLVMLSSPRDHIVAVRADFGYEADEKLNPTDIALYIANGRPKTDTGRAKRKGTSTLKRIVASPLGVEAIIFDETIQKMNSIQDALRYGAL